MKKIKFLNFLKLLNYCVTELLFLFLLSSPVLADRPPNIPVKEGTPLGPITGLGKFLPSGDFTSKTGAGGMLETIFSNILAVFTIIGGLAFVLYFVLGALSWITAGGATDKIEKAKNQMINAAIGLIIIVAAYAIIYIIGLVLGISILKPAEELEKIKP